MASAKSRTWTDPRDGTEWKVLFNPSVELDIKRVRDFRERLMFRGEGGSFDAPAVYGSSLEALTDEDLQGLLDQAREAAERREETDAWERG